MSLEPPHIEDFSIGKQESISINQSSYKYKTPLLLSNSLSKSMQQEKIVVYLENLISLADIGVLPEKINPFTPNINTISTVPIADKKQLKKTALNLFNIVNNNLPAIKDSQLGTILKNYCPTNTNTWKSFLKSLQSLIINQTSYQSAHPYLVRGYTNYYTNVIPHEEDATCWNNKQRNVIDILRKEKPATVLDLGCCTGWYSIKAAQMGATVFGIDIDEESLQILTETSIRHEHSIYPLKISFQELKNIKKYKLLYNCDVVLCLALLHHLIIVEGIDPQQAIKLLALLTPKTLVLEFVDLQDERIQYPYKHPEAIRTKDIYNFAKNNLEKLMPFYNQEFVIKELKKYFSSITIQASTPETTRSLLICKK